jgi:hypothetical protein
MIWIYCRPIATLKIWIQELLNRGVWSYKTKHIRSFGTKNARFIGRFLGVIRIYAFETERNENKFTLFWDSLFNLHYYRIIITQ